MCYVGDRLISSEKLGSGDNLQCDKNETGPLFRHWCDPDNNKTFDPDACKYFEDSDVGWQPGVPGVASGVIASMLSASAINNNYDNTNNRRFHKV